MIVPSLINPARLLGRKVYHPQPDRNPRSAILLWSQLEQSACSLICALRSSHTTIHPRQRFVESSAIAPELNAFSSNAQSFECRTGIVGHYKIDIVVNFFLHDVPGSLTLREDWPPEHGLPAPDHYDAGAVAWTIRTIHWN